MGWIPLLRLSNEWWLRYHVDSEKWGYESLNYGIRTQLFFVLHVYLKTVMWLTVLLKACYFMAVNIITQNVISRIILFISSSVRPLVFKAYFNDESHQTRIVAINCFANESTITCPSWYCSNIGGFIVLIFASISIYRIILIEETYESCENSLRI